jgi:hypothetical protein
MTPSYLSPQSVADAFPGLTADRLARWRWAHVGPNYVKAGRTVLYRLCDVEDFLSGNLVVLSDAGQQ